MTAGGVHTLAVHTLAAEETEGFGARLAEGWPGVTAPKSADSGPEELGLQNPGPTGLGRGDIFAVIYLTGDLGAGKTTLTRGFLRRLGVTGAVRSPTYTLVEVYEIKGEISPLVDPPLPGSLTVVHLDLYRLSDPGELDNLGLREYARPGCVWLVEWPERGLGRLPEPDLLLKLTGGEDGHDIEVDARSSLGSSWLDRMAAPQAS